MNIKHIIFIITLITSTHLFAAVPYNFTAGEAAVADHVNQNFQYLDSRIDTAVTEAETVSTQLEDGIYANTSDLADMDTRVTELETATGEESCSLLGQWEKDISSQLSYDGEVEIEGTPTFLWPNNNRIPYVDPDKTYENTTAGGWGRLVNPVTGANTPFLSPFIAHSSNFNDFKYTLSIVDDKDNCFESDFLIDGREAMVVTETEIVESSDNTIGGDGPYPRALFIYTYVSYILIKEHDVLFKFTVAHKPSDASLFSVDVPKVLRYIEIMRLQTGVKQTHPISFSENVMIDTIDNFIDYFHFGHDIDLSSYGFDNWLYEY